MEAKDTVMSDEQLEPYVSYACLCDHDGCLQAQVKITWDIAFKAGKMKGKKEVAEWVNLHIPQTLANYVGFWQEWQAFKEQEGIK